jgi:uncharacterized membrane protein
MEKIRFWSLILAAVGLLDSLYLSWVKLTSAYALCGPIGDCKSVNNSPYAEIAGIPIAILGAGAYLAILVLLFLEHRPGFWQEYSGMGVFGFTLVGTLYSAYLTYVELAIIHAVCPYCVVSAVIMVCLLVLSSIRLARSVRIS